MSFTTVQAATPPEFSITNTVSATYSNSRFGTLSASVSFDTDTDSPSTISFLQVATPDVPNNLAQNIQYSGALCQPAGNSNSNFDAVQLHDLSDNQIIPGNQTVIPEPSAYASGEAILISVKDYDQNLDASIVETVDVTVSVAPNNDQELIRLTETAPDSAIFLGGIQSVTQLQPELNNCLLEVTNNAQLRVTYVDENNNADTVSTTALIDPFGQVFDSENGDPINGVTVSLINVDTGAPAEVFSPNGIDVWPSTVITGENITDSSGATFEIADGNYRFPRIASGNYRLEVLPTAGYRFPSQQTDASLQLLDTGPYVLDIGSRGETFFVPPGPDVQLDIPLDPLIGTIQIDKRALSSNVSIGDFLLYEVSVVNLETEFSIANLELVDTLPKGFRLVTDSFRLDNAPLSGVSVASNGRTLRIPLGDFGAGRRASLSYVVEVTAGSPRGEAVNRITSDTDRVVTNVSQAVVQVSSDFFDENAFLVGRVIAAECGVDGPEYIGVPNVILQLETGDYVATDAEGAWNINDIKPGTHVLRIDESTLPEGYELTDCEENTRVAQTTRHQFVHLEAGELARRNFYVHSVDTEGSTSLDEQLENFLNEYEPPRMPEYFEEDIQSSEFKVLWPQGEYIPHIPSLSTAIQHPSTHTVELNINGYVVNPLNYDGRVINRREKSAISSWKGIDLPSGTSTLSVILKDRSGNEVNRIEQIVHVSGHAYSAEYVPELSRLTADGKTPPYIAVRIFDQYGKPMRAGVSGEFSVESPYRAWLPPNLRNEQSLLLTSGVRPRYLVQADGVAYLPIEATTRSGSINVQIPLARDRSELIEAWLKADARDWILIGLAENKYSYDKLSQHIEAIEDPNDVDGYSRDGRVAFVAKGRIKGDFLLSIAYDSDKDSSENPSQLNAAIRPDEYYQVYGDGSQWQNDTRSARKLYVKVEKERFYALFGDFQTDMNVTELSRYSRVLNGLKTEFKSDFWEANLFASETSLGNIREELRGDGTSGRYFLTRRDIVEGSDIISVEVRDRFETGEILSTRTLQRFSDYEIDYELGTLVFNTPIRSRDSDFNPIFIIVNYATQDEREAAINAGGRVELSNREDTAEFGVSFITERNRGQEADLVGLDLSVEVSDATEIVMEVARSNQQNIGQASASSAEITHESGAFTGSSYIRRQDAGFGVGQQNASETGTLKYGARLDWRLNSQYRLELGADHQQQLDVNTENNQLSLRARRDGKKISTQVGLRWAEDKSESSDVARSELITTGIAVRPNDKLQLNLNSEFSASNSDDSRVFPTRHLIGLDWKVTDAATLFVNQEITNGGSDTESTSIGLRGSPWQGAQMTLGMDRNIQSDSENSAAVAGFVQRIQLNKEWDIDLSLDRGQNLSDDTPVTGLSADSPPVSGSGGNDFTAVSVGWDWRNNRWSWTNRVEHRDADNDSRISYRTGVLRQLSEGTALLTSADWLQTERAGTEITDIELSIGYANRHLKNWILLNRLDWVRSQTTTDDSSLRAEKMISNNHLNYLGWDKHQLSLQYAAKYQKTILLNQEFSGFTDLIGMQYRHDLSDRWDIGAQASVLRSHASDISQSSYGLSLGYSPIKDTWVELGYNWSGFNDNDFKASEYTREGVHLSLRYKFDETTVKRFYSSFHQRVVKEPESVEQPEKAASSAVQKPKLVAKSPVLRRIQMSSNNIFFNVTDPSDMSIAAMRPLDSNTAELHAPVAMDMKDCQQGQAVHVLQAMSFSDLSRAKQLTLELKQAGFEHFFVEQNQTDANSSAVYRVIMGPFRQPKATIYPFKAQFDQSRKTASWLRATSCDLIKPLDSRE